MSAVTEVAVGLGVVLAVVGTMIYLAKKGFFAPDGNENSQQEREEMEERIGSQDFRIPFRRRVGAWSGPYKLFVASCGLLGLLVLYGVYDIMQTGAPASKYLTSEVRFGVIALVGVAGGVTLKSWFDAQLAYLTVEYERMGTRDLVERIPYARTAVSRRNGRTYVPEVTDSRLLGLFWRFRQVGEDRRLRGEEKPLDDVITHQVPDHGKEIPDGSGYHIRTQEDGDRVLSGATSAADIGYGSPASLSSERSVELREEKRRKEAELGAVQATNAELSKKIRKLRKKIENEEYDDRTELLGDFKEFSQMLNTLQVKVEENTNENGSAVGEDGDQQEAGA